MRTNRRILAVLTSLVALTAFVALQGCGGKGEEKSAKSDGYYDGPMKPKANTSKGGEAKDGP